MTDRALPKAYGDWHSVYVRFARRAKAGLWNRLFEALSADAGADFSEMFIPGFHSHYEAFRMEIVTLP